MIFSFGSETSFEVEMPFHLSSNIDVYCFTKVDGAIHIPTLQDDQLLYLVMASLNRKKHVLLCNRTTDCTDLDWDYVTSKHYIKSEHYLFLNVSFRNTLFAFNHGRQIQHFNDLVTY